VGIDPQGDLFGDYEFLGESASIESDGSDDDSDLELDIDNTPWLEPSRPHVPNSPEYDIATERSSSELPDGNPVLRGVRAFAESRLEREPFVVHYPTASGVGQVQTAPTGANVEYQSKLMQGDENLNIYTPFASRLEWEIAKWAKLRGPGSTAFNDLMAIEGVRASVGLFKRQKSHTHQVQQRLGLSFKTTQELNKIIDDELPGRPPFQCHEVMVDNEVCEVFYRDVVACIRTLFGNPDFAPVLAFQPVKHYADEKKEERMYHDMHTGRWWWCTQVCRKGCRHQNVAYFVSIEGSRCHRARRNYCSDYHIERQNTVNTVPK